MSGCHPDDIQTSPSLRYLGSGPGVQCGASMVGVGARNIRGFGNESWSWGLVSGSFQKCRKNEEFVHFCGGLSQNVLKYDICPPKKVDC